VGGEPTFAEAMVNGEVAPEAVVPAPRLAAALVMRLQTEAQLRPRYFCLGPITRTARPLFRFVETARPNRSRLRSCARLPDEDLVLIGDLFSQSASRRSTTRTATNWILPDGWGG
jgi:hypothetical protein